MQPMHLSFATVALAALANFVPSPAPAPPIPTTQRDVETGDAFTNSVPFVPVLNSSVTINNGSSARKVVVTFSAEARVDPGTGMELGYSLDGGGCFKQAGPTAFSANQTAFYAVFTAVHVIPLGSGVHTIQACYRSASGNRVFLKDRTLIAEGRTK
ncbi:MAG TPA: hypothetical protein VIC59_00435 [Gemmatimonadota bacterium]|jgi:hypothetical protein